MSTSGQQSSEFLRNLRQRSTVVLRIAIFILAQEFKFSGCRIPVVDAERVCRLWLAPSYLSSSSKEKKTTKLGVYAGVEFQENETLPHSEIAIPLVDIFTDEKKSSWTNELDQRVLHFLDSLVWTGEFAGSQWEGNHSAPVLVPGLGLLANYHSGVANIAWDQASSLLRERQSITNPGVPHPSRGAISSFYNMTMRATRKIPRGMELFADFGDTWDESQEDLYQDRITRKDYIDADLVVRQIVEFMDAYDDDLDDSLMDDILDFVLEKVLPLATEKRAKTIRSLIPARHQKLSHIVELGGTFEYRYSEMIRSDEWFKEHGLCLDNLYAGESRIPGAGRGAFAARSFKPDEIIAPVPLIPITSPKIFWDVEPSRANFSLVDEPRLQLLENYCLGHPESSMRLFMAGPLNSLINHGKIGQHGNAYLLWSLHSDVINDHSLHDRTVAEIASLSDQPMITMTLHALKDIKQGEEVLIDYEIDWVEAWSSYMQQWRKRTEDGTWPLKAEDVKLISKSQPYPTSQTQNAYPPGVSTVCYLQVTDPVDGSPRRTKRNVKILRWVGPATRDEYRGDILTPCNILYRFKTDDEYTYNVEAVLPGTQEMIQVNGVPHKAISLVDLPYTSDTFSPHVFRHYIGIRDQSFPQAWRDLR